MEKAAKIMYRIAKVFAIVGICVGATLALIGMFITIFSVGNNMAAGLMLLMFGSYYLITHMVSLIVCSRAVFEIECENKEIKYPITNIVLGAISSNPFYIVGGVFNLFTRKF